MPVGALMAGKRRARRASGGFYAGSIDVVQFTLRDGDPVSTTTLLR